MFRINTVEKKKFFLSVGQDLTVVKTDDHYRGSPVRVPAPEICPVDESK